MRSWRGFGAGLGIGSAGGALVARKMQAGEGGNAIAKAGKHAKSGRLVARSVEGNHLTKTGAALTGVAAAGGVIGAAASRNRKVAKADQSKPSRGRLAAGTLFPGFHGAIAGKKGRKLGATGVELGSGVAGSVAGSLVGLGAHVASDGRIPAGMPVARWAGNATGANMATRHNQMKGRYKTEPVTKSMTVLPTRVTFSQARNPLGQFASHATDVKIVHANPARAVDGRLVEAHGKSGLFPARTARDRTRPPHSASPNGAAIGHRLT
jgi:hypothetical protein